MKRIAWIGVSPNGCVTAAMWVDIATTQATIDDFCARMHESGRSAKRIELAPGEGVPRHVESSHAPSKSETEVRAAAQAFITATLRYHENQWDRANSAAYVAARDRLQSILIPQEILKEN